jgi:hypothetical protein
MLLHDMKGMKITLITLHNFSFKLYKSHGLKVLFKHRKLITERHKEL